MRWAIIKSFLKNPLLKISYIILVLLPIILEILGSLKVIPHYPQMIYNVYYSGVCIIVAFIIYSIFAPAQITKYEDSHDYLGKMLPILKEYNPNKRKNVVLAHLDETEKQQRAQIETLYHRIDNENDVTTKNSLETNLTNLVEPLYVGCATRYLLKEWDIKDKSRKLALVICLLFSIAAAGFAIWVSYERIKIVITHNFS